MQQILISRKLVTDFTKILDKAKEPEANMKDSQTKIKNIIAEGSSGGDKVKITLNGDNEIIKIFVSNELLNESKELLEDLIMAAHNNARLSLKQKTKDEIAKITSGFGLPGFKWPL